VPGAANNGGEDSPQSMTAKKEQALSITFWQSYWFIFSLHDMLTSAPLSGLSFTMAQSDCEIASNCGKI
jgi:hypothetical protein